MAANALVVVSNEANVMLTKTREYFIVHSFLNESVSRYFVVVLLCDRTGFLLRLLCMVIHCFTAPPDTAVTMCF